MGPTISWLLHACPTLSLDHFSATAFPRASQVLLDGGYNAKLADFGVSREVQEENTMTCIGTPAFLAPECLRSERYGVPADIWSVGCIMCVLWTHDSVPVTEENIRSTLSHNIPKCPKTEEMDLDLPVRMGHTKIRRMTMEGLVTPRLPNSCFMANVVERCCERDSTLRPPVCELLETLHNPDLYAAAVTVPPGPQPGLRGACSGGSSESDTESRATAATRLSRSVRLSPGLASSLKLGSGKHSSCRNSMWRFHSVKESAPLSVAVGLESRQTATRPGELSEDPGVDSGILSVSSTALPTPGEHLECSSSTDASRAEVAPRFSSFVEGSEQPPLRQSSYL